MRYIRSGALCAIELSARPPCQATFLRTYAQLTTVKLSYRCVELTSSNWHTSCLHSASRRGTVCTWGRDHGLRTIGYRLRAIGYRLRAKGCQP